MAMKLYWHGPGVIRAECRVHDIRAVLDECDAWRYAGGVRGLIDADPHTPVVIEKMLTKDGWGILSHDGQLALGNITDFVVDAMCTYNHHVGPDTDPLYIDP